MNKKIYAVAGNPILHSRSPQLFSAACEKTEIPAIYTRLYAENAEEVIRTARGIGISGLNITAPFKESIIPFLDEVNSDAKKIGAVNCVIFKNGKAIGYNTDFIGVSSSLSQHNITVPRKNCLVIGAGGAAKAAIYALVRNGGNVTLVNRSTDRAQKVADHFGVATVPLAEIDAILHKTDIVISTIPALSPLFDVTKLPRHATLFDANYGNSPLVTAAKSQGINIISGEEWLIYQAIPSFKLFFDRETDYKTMHTGLNNNLLKNSPIFVGFMMSGKTKIGRQMAENTDQPFFDTDELISNHENASISDIFSKKGEKQFREIEHRILAETVKKQGVISTGGGIVSSKENRALLRNHFPVIWLYTSLDETIKRLEYEDGIERKSRPLLHTDDWKDRVTTLFYERLPLYAEVADIIVNTTDFDQAKLAEIVESQYTSLR